MSEFYIYRHIRLDTNTPFYVGKGSGKRAYSLCGHNDYWYRTVKKAGYEVEIIMGNLSEGNAFVKEREFISLYKKLGYCQANLTDGGEGLSGFIMTAETRAKMSASQTGRTHSAETLAKISAGNKGKVISAEQRAKISVISKARIHSAETRAKISAAGKGRTASPETLVKMSAAQTGKVFSAEHRAKISKSKSGIRPHSSKTYINTLTNIVYPSGLEASSSINMKYATFMAQINGRNPNKTNFIKISGGVS